MGVEGIDGIPGVSGVSVLEAMKKAEEEKTKMGLSVNPDLMTGNFVQEDSEPSRYVQATQDSLRLSAMGKMQQQSRITQLIDDMGGIGGELYKSPAAAKGKVNQDSGKVLSSVMEEEVKRLKAAMKQAEQERQQQEAVARAATEGKSQVVIDSESGEMTVVTPDAAQADVSTPMPVSPGSTAPAPDVSGEASAPIPAPATTGAADVTVGTPAPESGADSGGASASSSGSSSFHLVV